MASRLVLPSLTLAEQLLEFLERESSLFENRPECPNGNWRIRMLDYHGSDDAIVLTTQFDMAATMVDHLETCAAERS